MWPIKWRNHQFWKMVIAISKNRTSPIQAMITRLVRHSRLCGRRLLIRRRLSVTVEPTINGHSAFPFGTLHNSINKGQIPLRCPARQQVADQLVTKFRYAIQLAASSPAGRRLASEQDSVMEYGLNRSATTGSSYLDMSIARTCLRQVGNQVCDQVCDVDSVMEVGLKHTVK